MSQIFDLIFHELTLGKFSVQFDFSYYVQYCSQMLYVVILNVTMNSDII